MTTRRPLPPAGALPGARFRRRRAAAAALAGALVALPAGWGMTSREAKQRAFQTLNQGTLLYEQGDYRGAVDLLRQAANISLNSFQAHYQLGLALREARQYGEAIEALGVALELSPRHLQAHVALGDCHLKMGDVREAGAEYHRALDLQPDYAAAYDGLGRLMESVGRPEDGVYYYQRAIEANAGYPDAYLDLGDLYLRQARLQEAAVLLLKAIQIRPDFAGAFNRLGAVYARQELWQEAIAALREAERLEPKNPYHPFTLGSTYLALGSLRWAREALERALALDPQFQEAYVELAALERREGNYEHAIGVLQTGLARADHVEMRQELESEITRMRAERDQVEALQSRAMKGGDTQAVLALARHYAGAGDFKRASQTLDGRLAAERDEPALVAEWGYYQIKARRYAEAGATLQSLTRRLEGGYAVYVNLGIAQAGAGDHELAESAYRAALRVKPDGAEALLYLGNLYLRQGELERGREQYQAYLKVAQDEAGMGRVRKILDLLERLQPAGADSAAAAARSKGGAP